MVTHGPACAFAMCRPCSRWRSPAAPAVRPRAHASPQDTAPPVATTIALDVSTAMRHAATAADAPTRPMHRRRSIPRRRRRHDDRDGMPRLPTRTNAADQRNRRPNRTYDALYASDEYDPVADPTLPAPARNADQSTTRGRNSTAGCTASTTRSTAPSPAAGQGYVEGGAAAGAAGRKQFLQQPRPAGQRDQRAAAGQAQAGRAVAGPFPAQHRRWASAASSTRRPTPSCRNKQRGLRPDAGRVGLEAVALRRTAAVRAAHRARRVRPGRRRAAVADPPGGRGQDPHLPAGPAAGRRARAVAAARQPARRRRRTNTRCSATRWLQRRNYQIFGDRKREDDEELPDYLLEEEANPTVPVDAMPIMPGSPAP